MSLSFIQIDRRRLLLRAREDIDAQIINAALNGFHVDEGVPSASCSNPSHLEA